MLQNVKFLNVMLALKKTGILKHFRFSVSSQSDSEASLLAALIWTRNLYEHNISFGCVTWLRFSECYCGNRLVYSISFTAHILSPKKMADDQNFLKSHFKYDFETFWSISYTKLYLLSMMAVFFPPIFDYKWPNGNPEYRSSRVPTKPGLQDRQTMQHFRRIRGLLEKHTPISNGQQDSSRSVLSHWIKGGTKKQEELSNTTSKLPRISVCEEFRGGCGSWGRMNCVQKYVLLKHLRRAWRSSAARKTSLQPSCWEEF